MRKIAIDARLTDYRQGGIAEYMRQLIGALADLGPGQQFYVLRHFRGKAPWPLPESFQALSLYTPPHHRWEGLALGAELWPRRLDLLHSPDFIPPRWGAKNYIITVHDLAFLYYPEVQTPASLRYYAGQIERALEQAARIIAVSQTTRQDLIKLLGTPAEQIRVIYEGLHPQFRPLSPQAREPILHRYPLPPDYLLFVGTIEPRKNLPRLLAAYALLCQKQPQTPPLVLVGGDGWLSEASFQAIIDLRLSERVIWLGGVPFEDLPALYSGARLHLLLSLYEGFGFPPLEAMACGTPSLVSDRGSLPEIVGQAAWLANPEDIEDMAAQMHRLLEDEDLRQTLQQRGLAHVQGYTWAQAAQETLAVYHEVLG
jgi:glycosyltransferase involved in cell wall biosynthesis